MWHDIYIKSPDDRFRHYLNNLRGYSVEGFMTYTVEMASCGMTYIPSFMKSGTGVQVILRLCLGNLNGCNVGITDGRGS
jgi:uncharacterized protein YraI